MKKHLLFYLLFLLIAMNSRAQQHTPVTIGTSTTAAKNYGPIIVDHTAPTNYFSRHMGLYLASEINATPFTARALTKIAWYKDDTARYNTTGGAIKIYLKHTTNTTIGNFMGANWTTESTGATEVINLAMPAISSGAGWKEFVLPAPFVWDGSSNLEVLVEWTGVGTITNSLNWRYSAVTGNRSANTMNTLPSGIPVTTNLPNIQFTFTTFNNDAGISAITSPLATVLPNVSTPVQVTLKNFGANALTTATIGWKVNGVAQPDYSWNGNLASQQTIGAITLGNVSLPLGGHTIKAYPKSVNGGADALAVNDTTTLKIVACSALAGNYTINKNAPASGTNFTSFASAAAVLNSCGVSGAVTITVAPGSGPYNESVALVNIQGTSAINTVTFEGNGNTVSSANTFVILLDRSHRVKLNNLVVEQTSTATLCYGIQLIGPSDYATISNCTINMPANTNSNVLGIALVSGSNANTAGNYSNHSLFENNIINNGYYAIRMSGLAVTGSSPIGAADIRIIGNQFRNFYNYGIYMTQADGVKIESNTFTRPTRTTLVNYNGVYLSTGCINTIISKNRFHNTHGAVVSPTNNVFPVTVEAAAAAGSENIIKNNLIYNLNNTSNITAINLFSTATGVHIYHNSFSIENPNRPASNSSTIKVLGMSGSGANVRFVNNIVSINMPGTGAKHAIHLGAVPVATFVSNNNVLHIASGLTNAHTGYLTSDRTTLANWQAANTAAPFDLNSVDANPMFTNLTTGDLKPTSPGVDNIGQPVASVQDDILGNPRSATTPDAGAYEFSLGTNDAGIAGFVSPTTPALPGVALPVQVTLKNFGTANLNAATIGWKVNGVAQPDFAWTGSLAQNATAAVTIGNFTFAAGTHTMCAWTKMPNGATDTNAANDSSCTTINACAPLAGNYTINKNAAASATNFQSFTAAAERLHNCGVSGRVVMSVVSGTGPYTEHVNIMNIPGASAANSIVFQGNGNTLNATPNAQKNTVIKLDNADYVRINNLNIVMNGTGGVGNPTFTGVQLVNNSDNDTISNCTITVPQAIGINSDILGILAGSNITVAGNNTNNSVFMNNTISGGVYGIKINGEVNGTNAVNNKVIGNTVLDGNGYGIVLDNADGSLVENNVIQRPTLATPFTFYGISLTGISKNTTIRKNRINNLFNGAFASGGSAYGIYLTGSGAPAGSENKIVNNLINDTNTPANFYGIYNNGSSGVFIYHNAIISTPNDGFYGYYQTTTAATNIKFNNNLVAAPTGAGSLNKYAIYLGGVIETDNNVYYIASNIANRNIGYYAGVSYATLAAWKNANNNTFDQQSVETNPMLRNTGNGNLIPTSPFVNNVGKPLAAVTTDILNNARNAATPDPGAYEFTPSMADAAVVAIISPVSNCGLTNQETVTISIKNFASVAPTTIPVSFEVDGGTPVVETFTGTLPFNSAGNYTFTAKANLSAQGPHTIKIKTLLPGDTDPSNDTMTVKIMNVPQLALPVNLDFESPASGISVMDLKVKANSTITEDAAASNGTNSTKGMIMAALDSTNWTVPGGAIDPWTTNPEKFAAANLCISTANTSLTDTLRLHFDLKQLFKNTNANTNFRVTVNGAQVGPTYRPPFGGGTPVWQQIVVDLSAYLNQQVIKVGLESSVKEAYANGTGTANLIDNIQVIRTAGPNTGVKDDMLASNVQVYPNPSNGLFNVMLPKGKDYKLIVTDLSGKVLKMQTAKDENNRLNLEGTAKGIYLLHVSGENGSAVRKLIVD